MLSSRRGARARPYSILQDLAPLARQRGYVPVYASLWQNVNAPHEGLITAFEEAIAALGRGAAFGRLLRANVKRASASNELLGKLEVEFADDPGKPADRDLARLDELLETLVKKAGKKTVLLLIDEVQHLATCASFHALAHTLRTMLDKRQGKVKGFFTGSSRHYMNLLFNESQSAFYHFVETVPFPDLDGRFIEFLRRKLADDHKREGVGAGPRGGVIALGPVSLLDDEAGRPHGHLSRHGGGGPGAGAWADGGRGGL